MSQKKQKACELKARDLAASWGYDETLTAWAVEASQLSPFSLVEPAAGEDTNEYNLAVDYVQDFCFGDDNYRNQKRAQVDERKAPKTGPSTRKSQAAGGDALPEKPQAKRAKREVEGLLGNDGMGPGSSMALVRQRTSASGSLPSTSAAGSPVRHLTLAQLLLANEEGCAKEEEYIDKLEKYAGKLLKEKCVAPAPTTALLPANT